jgi:magnesium chelatase subunit D
VLDAGEVHLQRDGFASRFPARLAVIALDEGLDADEALAPSLRERLALYAELDAVTLSEAVPPPWSTGDIAAARALLPAVEVDAAIVEKICATALALGIGSARAPQFALHACRAAAALAGRRSVTTDDAALAARLVLAPRATRLPPQEESSEQQSVDRDDSAGSGQPDSGETNDAEAASTLEDQVLAAARASIPADLLLRMAAAGMSGQRARSAGKSGLLQRSSLRGRPAGVRKGAPRAGIRLSVIDTLRAAAPWQRLRREQAHADGIGLARVHVRREDFHVRRYRQAAETATLFVLDASGSAALHRLAEAKGAVELLLAQCYLRRDRVAVIAFRGKAAELLLSPTRSLVRAKRSLAGLPGGGATPLAAGIEAGAALAASMQRQGLTPTLVLMTDGRGNMTLAGQANRQIAEQEAIAASRRLRTAGHRVLLVDTSPRPQPGGLMLARELGALYLPLPHADSRGLAAAVTQAGGRGH